MPSNPPKGPTGDTTLVNPALRTLPQRATLVDADATVIVELPHPLRQRPRTARIGTRSSRRPPAEDRTIALVTGAPPLPDLPSGLRTPALALATGFRLREYRIESVLGQGGFGITYLATDVNLNAAVAMKEYLPAEIAFRAGDCSVSPNASRHADRYRQGLHSFLAEARTLAGFRHPNIVRVARFFEAHRTAYMVLDYVRGAPLKTWWPGHRAIGETGLIALLLPLLDGLSVVHAQGFLHRDIKPDNIQVRAADGRLVLLDFGSSGQTVALAAEHGAVVLTPGFAPIEQYALGEQGAWTDIYALGATLYWAVSGSKPPDAEMRSVDPACFKPAMEVGRGRYGEAFLWAIDWALEMDAVRRPQDVGEWRRALAADHVASLNLEDALSKGDSTLEDFRPTESPGNDKAVKPRQVVRTRRSRRAVFSPLDWPLAVKMTLAMLATALLPMGITGASNLRGSTAALSEAELRFVEHIANSTARRISQLITDSRYLARALAADGEFVSVLQHSDALTVAAIGDRLVRIQQTNPDIQRIGLIDAKGTVVVSTELEAMGKNQSGERFFQEAVQGRAFTSGMQFGAPGSAPGVLLAQPMQDETGAVRGMLALRLRGSSLAAIVDEVRSDATLTPFLIDAKGVLVHHIQEDLIQSRLGDAALATAMVGAQRTGHVSYRSARNERDEIAGFAPVNAHDWVVGVSKSRSDFEEPLVALKAQLEWSIALVGLLFTGLSLMFARSIVRPIRALTTAARALKEGHFDKAEVEVRRLDELGALGRTFNVMIEALRQRDRERRHD